MRIEYSLLATIAAIFGKGDFSSRTNFTCAPAVAPVPLFASLISTKHLKNPNHAVLCTSKNIICPTTSGKIQFHIFLCKYYIFHNSMFDKNLMDLLPIQQTKPNVLGFRDELLEWLLITIEKHHRRLCCWNHWRTIGSDCWVGLILVRFPDCHECQSRSGNLTGLIPIGWWCKGAPVNHPRSDRLCEELPWYLLEEPL